MSNPDLGERLAAAGRITETLDERRREADIHARLFGASIPVHIGRYRVQERLGAGAMGTVFAAHDDRLDRSVAIKVLTDRSAEGQALTLREARGLARLTHPNVVRIYEADTDGERVFIVMESLQGETLATWPSGRSPGEILDVYLAAGRGLVAVHAAGLVHRDFKPANVMIDGHGHARLIDFGLARRVDAVAGAPAPDLRGATTATMTGALVGTPAYMAPELLAGQPATPLSDQFAFCAALYESLLAERPFQGDSIPDLQAQMIDGVPQSSRLPAPIARVIARGLAVEPADRWPDMRALLAALQQTARRPRWAIVVLVVVGLAALGWAFWPKDAARPTAPASTRAATAGARPLPAAPALAAAVLAARDADHGWRAAAEATLARPMFGGVVARFDGAPTELLPFTSSPAGAVSLAARMPDHSLWHAHDGRVEPTRWSAIARRCDLGLYSLGIATAETVDGAKVCHRDAHVIRRDGVWAYHAANGAVGQPLVIPPNSVWWIGGDSLLVDDAGQLSRQPLLGGEAPTRPAALHDVRRVAQNDGVTLALRADGALFVWRAGQAPWPMGTVDPGARLYIAPHGRWLVVFSRGRVQIFADEAAQPFVLPGSWRAHLAFDPSGRWLAIISSDDALVIWDLKTRRSTRLSLADCTALSWSSEGLLAALRDGRVVRYNTDGLTGQSVGSHTANVWSGDMAPDRRRWVTAGMDGTAKIWSLDAPPVTLRGHARGVFTAIFSPDGRHVATGSSDGSARLWSATGGDAIVFPAHETWAYALAFSPDGAHLATASKTGVVREWPRAGGAARVLAEAGDPARMRRVHGLAYAPNGDWLAVGTKAGRVRTLSTRGKPAHELPAQAYDAHLFYDAQGRLVTYGTDPQVRVFTPDGATLLRAIDSPAPVRTVIASAAGLVWSTTKGDLWIKPDGEAMRRLGELDGQPEMLALDATEARVIAGSSSGDLVVWRLADGHQTTLPGHLDAVRFVGFDANGDAISAGADGQVRRWPLTDDEASLRRRLRAATDLCLDPAQRTRWLTADEAARLRCEQRKRP